MATVYDEYLENLDRNYREKKCLCRCRSCSIQANVLLRTNFVLTVTARRHIRLEWDGDEAPPEGYYWSLKAIMELAGLGEPMIEAGNGAADDGEVMEDLGKAWWDEEQTEDGLCGNWESPFSLPLTAESINKRQPGQDGSSAVVRTQRAVPPKQVLEQLAEMVSRTMRHGHSEIAFTEELLSLKNGPLAHPQFSSHLPGET